MIVKVRERHLESKEGKPIQSAVYLADNIVSTRNGDTSLHPWKSGLIKCVAVPDHRF